jgi:hypothetical protein
MTYEYFLYIILNSIHNSLSTSNNTATRIISEVSTLSHRQENVDDLYHVYEIVVENFLIAPLD